MNTDIRILSLIRDLVGETEAANIHPDQVERAGHSALAVGDPNYDGTLLVHADDRVEIWAQGTSATDTYVPGSYAHFAARVGS